jgi:hypothetical protein
MSWWVENLHACDAISVVTEFMVDVGGLKPSMRVIQSHASRAFPSLTVVNMDCLITLKVLLDLD